MKYIKTINLMTKKYAFLGTNFFYTNAIYEQHLELLVWAYAFKLISNRLTFIKHSILVGFHSRTIKLNLIDQKTVRL